MMEILIVLAIIPLIILLKRIFRQPVQGVYMAIFASGILITPSFPVVREKFATTEVLMLITWAAVFLNRFRWDAPGIPLLESQKQLIFWGSGFIASVVVSFLINLANISDRIIPRATVETANYVYGFLLFITLVFLVDNWDKWRKCVYAWLLGSAVISFFGMWAVLGGAPAWTYDDFTGRISSTMKFENQVPSYLIPGLAASVFLGVMKKMPVRRGIILLILSGMSVLTLFGTGSRTAFIMLLIVLFGIICLAIRERAGQAFYFSRLQSVAFVIIGGIVIYVVTVLAGSSTYAIGKTSPYERPIRLLAEWAEGRRVLDMTRARQIEKVWDNFVNHPILGTGPKISSAIYRMAEIHNTYLNLLMETGLTGIILFLIWIWYIWQSASTALRQCKNSSNRLLGKSILIGFLGLLIYGLFILGLRQRNFWFAAGLLAALPRVIAAEQLTGEKEKISVASSSIGSLKTKENRQIGKEVTPYPSYR